MTSHFGKVILRIFFLLLFSQLGCSDSGKSKKQNADTSTYDSSDTNTGSTDTSTATITGSDPLSTSPEDSATEMTTDTSSFADSNADSNNDTQHASDSTGITDTSNSDSGSIPDTGLNDSDTATQNIIDTSTETATASDTSSATETGAPNDTSSTSDNNLTDTASATDSATNGDTDTTQDTATETDTGICINGFYQDGTTPCGLNDRSAYQQECINGVWTNTNTCPDSDVCVDSDTQSLANDCGYNNRGIRLQLCTTGAWVDDSCADSDVCADSDTQTISNACGINVRGTLDQLCATGTWVDGACADSDVCADSDTQTILNDCGFNNRGVQTQICSTGIWVDGTCADSDVCADSDTQSLTNSCGINVRGTLSQLCATGAWVDGTCADSDVCADSDTQSLTNSCGINIRGTLSQLCTSGAWVNGTCADSDVCADSDTQSLTNSCGINVRGTLSQLCTSGAWVDGACADSDICADSDTQTLANSCGINIRGTQLQECLTGDWVDGTCTDPDNCLDSDTQIVVDTCGLNNRGDQAQTCATGGWTDDTDGCTDPDICRDSETQSVGSACGVDTQGDQYQTCDTGMWVNTVCDDPDICSDTAVDCGADGSCAYDTDSDNYIYVCTCNSGYENSDTANLSSPCQDIPCFTETAGAGCAPNAHCDGNTIADNCACDLGYLGNPVSGGCNDCDTDGLGYLPDGMGGCEEIPKPGQADLVITEVMISPESSSTTADGQYFEVYNVSGIQLNLANTVFDLDGAIIALPSSPVLLLDANQYMVFGANDNTLQNGGVAVDVALTGFPELIAADGAITLTNAYGAIDSVSWNATDYVQDSGASMSLSPSLALNADASYYNDLPGYWCPTSTTQIFFGGDYGTPGGANDTCNVLNCTITAPLITVYDATYTDPTLGLVVAESDDLFVRVHHSLYTAGVGNLGTVSAQLSYGPRYSEPQDWTSWNSATYFGDAGTSNEYDVFTAKFTDVPLGVYFFAFRVSVDSGANWTYCDTTWTTPYDGYDLAEGGVMSVTDHSCVPGVNQCQDCLDNDGNGLVDGMDPKCLFSLDTTEEKLRTEINGDETTAIGAIYDCFVDGNSGEGDDVCAQNSCCNLHDPDIDDYLDLNLKDADPGLPNCPVDCPALCGDGLCSLSESYIFCPADCDAQCGNDACDIGETPANCPTDCSASCGDGMCTHDETYLTCSADCKALCGNDICEMGHPNCAGFTSPNNKGIILADECRISSGKYAPITGCANTCAPFIPTGCDCWGCCTICIDNICENVFTDPHANYWSDVSDPAYACNEANFDDPTKCMRCEQASERAKDCAIDCAASCGDGYCTHNEQGFNGAAANYCATDCTTTCGDGNCNTGDSENSGNCPVDCTTPLCGDGICSAGEQPQWSEVDSAYTGCDDCSPNCGDSDCGLICGTRCDPDNCIICPGMTEDDLPSHCTQAVCPNGWDVCKTSTDCASEAYYCVSGCCVPNA